MRNFYNENHTVNYSEVDANGNLRIDYIFSELQRITAFHSKEMGCDGGKILKDCNAIWVLGKMKLQILDFPSMFDKIDLQTWPTKVSAVRFSRDYKIQKDLKDIVLATSEWCVLDANTHTLRRGNTICYPFDMKHKTETSGCQDFSKLKESILETDFNHSHCVRYTDVDMNNHTNNIAYVRMALNCFTVEELDQFKISEIEMYYLNESYFNDNIKVYKKQTDYGYFITGKIGDKTIFDCVIKGEK